MSDWRIIRGFQHRTLAKAAISVDQASADNLGWDSESSSWNYSDEVSLAGLTAGAQAR